MDKYIKQIADLQAELADEKAMNEQKRISIEIMAETRDDMEAENERLKQGIRFAIGELPECPDAAKDYLTGSIRKGIVR